MAETKTYAPGTFCWVDLATTDAAGAKQFYTKLFDWEIVEVDAGDDGSYSMLTKQGNNVCALYPMMDEMRQQGVPVSWQSYVTVADVDECCDKVEELGGQVLQGPFDIMDFGRMAIVQDPLGATVSLWQPHNHRGADLWGEPGSVCWNELYTTDIEAAVQFYSGLFGWEIEKSAGAIGQPYYMFKSSGAPVGGMMEIQKDWGPVPPHWGVYFAVDDCDAAVAKAQGLGGTMEMPPMDIPNIGRFSIVADPQGGHFAVFAMPQPQ